MLKNYKIIEGRIQHKNDIEENWKKAVNFVPLKAEIIIYLPDETHETARFKIGDGETNVNDLDFVSFNEIKGSLVQGKDPVVLNLYSTVFGGDCLAGVLGYYISRFKATQDATTSIWSVEIDVSTTQCKGLYESESTATSFTLIHSDTDVITPPIADIQYSANDILTVLIDYKLESAISVTSVSGNTIYGTWVSNEKITNAGITSGNEDEYTIYCIAKPTLGEVPLGWYAHAEGWKTQALEKAAHAEGRQTIAWGQFSHAEGRKTEAGYAAHSEGRETKAIGDYSHAEGNGSESTGYASHSEGRNTKATEIGAHSEGSDTIAGGQASHAGGVRTQANGGASHAGGEDSVANYTRSFVHGKNVHDNEKDQFVIGNYNDDFVNGAFIIGNGNSSTSNNAFVVTKDGKAFADKTVGAGEGLVTLYNGTDLHTSSDSSKINSYQLELWSSTGAFHQLGLNIIDAVTTAYTNGNPLHTKLITASGKIYEGGLAIDAYKTNSAETISKVRIITEAGTDNLPSDFDFTAETVYLVFEERKDLGKLHLPLSTGVFGKYNEQNVGTIFMIGNGTDDENRSNAFEVKANGDVKIKGNIIIEGSIQSSTTDVGTEEELEAEINAILEEELV